MPYTGDRYCSDCFEERKNKASNYTYENIFDDHPIRTFGISLIPFIGLGVNIGTMIKYPNGDCDHLYIEGRHEKWSRNSKDSNNMKKCDNCSQFVTYYHQLENWES